MRSWTAFLAALIMLTAASGAAAQGPPPPVTYSGPETLDGYRMGPLFQRWVAWVEARKGPVLDAALLEPAPPGALRRRGAILQARASQDYGTVLVADVANHCPEATPFGQTEGCSFRLRKLQIPFRADSYGDDDTLADWTRQNFDPASVVAAMKAAGLAAPGTEWFDGNRVFTALPSPDAVLRSGLKVETTDAGSCPGLTAALNALEGQPLSLTVDLWGVGTDRLEPPPRPHGTMWRYKVQAFGGDRLLIDARQSVEALVLPVWTSVADCPRLEAQ